MALSLTQTTGTPLAARSCRPGHHIPNPAMYISPSSGTAPRLIARSILSRSRTDKVRSCQYPVLWLFTDVRSNACPGASDQGTGRCSQDTQP